MCRSVHEACGPAASSSEGPCLTGAPGISVSAGSGAVEEPDWGTMPPSTEAMRTTCTSRRSLSQEVVQTRAWWGLGYRSITGGAR